MILQVPYRIQIEMAVDNGDLANIVSLKDAFLIDIERHKLNLTIFVIENCDCARFVFQIS